MSALKFAAAAGALHVAVALNNGLALTPPLGLNSYMSGESGEAFLLSVANFFISSGMAAQGFTYVNTDEGWELSTRNASTGELQWDPHAYPSGIPAFTAQLASMGMRFGIYGAASGVTCGGVSGQLFHETLDATTFADWGVSYYKSDNCASYALDSSLRFAAVRDALNRTGARILLSIEPFSIHPDPAQSVKVANVWRVAMDISADFGTVTNRADISDKWAPLAGPGGYNDPDMIAVQGGGESNDGFNRVYFGLFAIIKAPLLLSATVAVMSSPSVLPIINNSEVIAVNQDPLGVQARKLMLGGARLPWLVGLEDCEAAMGPYSTTAYSRAWTLTPGAGGGGGDNRAWTPTQTSEPGVYSLLNDATGRCLSVAAAQGVAMLPVLLPCNASDPLQQWRFDLGMTTLTSITNVATQMAVGVTNSTLFSGAHGTADPSLPDAAYGTNMLAMVSPVDPLPCTSRSCEGYDHTQMWYFDPTERKLRMAAFTSSINHCYSGDCYVLTPKVPTWRHHCLAHVLSIRNAGTDAAPSEVWGGPLVGGSFVLGLLNRGANSSTITAPFDALEWPGVGPTTQFCVRDLWAHAELGVMTGSVAVSVNASDIALLRLYAPPCAA